MEQIQAAEIVRTPARLDFDDAPEGAGTEGVRGMVEGEGHATTVRVGEVAMAAFCLWSLKPSA